MEGWGFVTKCPSPTLFRGTYLKQFLHWLVLMVSYLEAIVALGMGFIFPGLTLPSTSLVSCRIILQNKPPGFKYFS